MVCRMIGAAEHKRRQRRLRAVEIAILVTMAVTVAIVTIDAIWRLT